MRLADYTDYTLRVLMYCASNPDRLVTIAEIADVHGVSKNHLMKIVNDLARQGVLETSRGRGGAHEDAASWCSTCSSSSRKPRLASSRRSLQICAT